MPWDSDLLWFAIRISSILYIFIVVLLVIFIVAVIFIVTLFGIAMITVFTLTVIAIVPAIIIIDHFRIEILQAGYGVFFLIISLIKKFLVMTIIVKTDELFGIFNYIESSICYLTEET